MTVVPRDDLNASGVNFGSKGELGLQNELVAHARRLPDLTVPIDKPEGIARLPSLGASSLHNLHATAKIPSSDPVLSVSADVVDEGHLMNGEKETSLSEKKTMPNALDTHG